MANVFLKPEVIVRTALGLLEREIVLPQLVWRNAGGDFRGAKDDTISLRVPAYTSARTRVMRSATQVTIDELEETKVDVTLDTHVYKAIGVSDEELTLDIVSFGEQVLQPAMSAVARRYEEELASTMEAATYENEVTLDPTDPDLGIVDARRYLNDANVPFGERAVVVGSGIEAALLKSKQFRKADQAGGDSAFREAIVGRVAGFTVVTSNALDPDVGFAFHRTAYALGTEAPAVPDGATWGRSMTWRGLALRALRDYDFTNVRDRLLTDVFTGSSVVTDLGQIDDDGKFVPAATEDESGATAMVVRAVKLTLGS